MANYWITLNVSGSEADARRLSEAIAKIAATETGPGVAVSGPTLGEDWLSLDESELEAMKVRASNKTVISPPRGF